MDMKTATRERNVAWKRIENAQAGVSRGTSQRRDNGHTADGVGRSVRGKREGEEEEK